MNKIVKKTSSKHLRKTSESFSSQSNHLKVRGPDRLKTTESFCDFSDADNKTVKNQFIVTKRAKLYSKGHSKSVFKDEENNENITKGMSNFEILKRQAEMLQNSSFLKEKSPQEEINIAFHSSEQFSQTFLQQVQIPPIALKKSQRILTQAPQNLGQKKYIVNNEFISFKKISVLDKYRQNIKKLNKKKGKESERPTNIISGNYLEEMDRHPSFTSKKIECHMEQKWEMEGNKIANRPNSTFKKQKGSSAAKKFYQTGRYKNYTDKFNQSYCQSMHPNLRVKAMQMSNRNENANDQMVIICL